MRNELIGFAIPSGIANLRRMCAAPHPYSLEYGANKFCGEPQALRELIVSQFLVELLIYGACAPPHFVGTPSPSGFVRTKLKNR
jgi:hypothetical protein